MVRFGPSEHFTVLWLISRSFLKHDACHAFCSILGYSGVKCSETSLVQNQDGDTFFEAITRMQDTEQNLQVL